MFKQCPSCCFEWPRRVDFLRDPNLRLIGYQANFNVLAAGIFLFNHDCNGTLAVPAENFMDLYHGPIFKERASEGPQCPGHCLHQEDLSTCPARCECNYVREILQVIRQWPKTVVA